MRLDSFLKKTALVTQRSLAKRLCDAGAATVNGRVAKPAQELQPGDRLRLVLPQRCIEWRIVLLPTGNVAKRDRGRYVEVLLDEPRAD